MLNYCTESNWKKKTTKQITRGINANVRELSFKFAE